MEWFICIKKSLLRQILGFPHFSKVIGTLCVVYEYILLQRESFFLNFLVGHIHMSYFGATGTPALDFWWCLLWVSKPKWVLSYLHCGGECNVHSLRSTSGATYCQPLDIQHCGAPTGFISLARILLATVRLEPTIMWVLPNHSAMRPGLRESLKC